MHKELQIEKVFEGIIRVAMFSVLPLLGFLAWVVVFPIIAYGGIMTDINSAQGIVQTLLVFSLPMLLFLAAIPVLLECRKKATFKELGLVFEKNKKNMILLCINVIAALCMFGKLIFSEDSFGTVFPMLVQLSAIGISEEIICRSVLYHETKQVLKKDLWALIITSFIFAFLFHSGDSDMANLAVRVPLGLMLGSVRWYTGNVYNSILIHIWYNTAMLVL